MRSNMRKSGSPPFWKKSVQRVPIYVAGSCFEARRYGMAAGALCVAVQSQLGYSRCYRDERGKRRSLSRCALYRRFQRQRCQERDVLVKMPDLGEKLVNKSAIGLPAEEGYRDAECCATKSSNSRRRNGSTIWWWRKSKASRSSRRCCPRHLNRFPCRSGSINEKRIAGFALESRLPSVGTREFVEAGGLISYGADRAEHHRRVACYVDRILKGAKPADLPVEQPV